MDLSEEGARDPTEYCAPLTASIFKGPFQPSADRVEHDAFPLIDRLPISAQLEHYLGATGEPGGEPVGARNRDTPLRPCKELQQVAASAIVSLGR
jgi:hypothetical protein